MRVFSKSPNWLTPLFAALVFISCGGGNAGEVKENKQGSDNKTYENKVVLYTLSDPDMVNPVNYTSETSGYLNSQLYQQLLGIDFKTLELNPELAAKMPEQEVREDGKLLIHYTIRPEATWDDGTPITAKDVEFSLKVIKNPKVDCHRVRPYFEFIEEVIIDKSNPKKFTYVCSEPYMLAMQSSGDFAIIDKRVYDPEGIMDEFTIKQLNENQEKLTGDQKIIAFANSFNSEKYQREVTGGSGPYELEKWETNQRVVIRKKKDWYGDKMEKPNMRFEAHPEVIVYETITDQTTALTALQSEQLDVMKGIDPKDFNKLRKDPEFTSNFHTFTPPMLAYEYIALNMKNPVLEDVKVRKALAHLMDVNKIVENIYYGLAERVIGFVNPYKEKFYNNEITPYPYDVEKAKSLLAEAGWKDSNGNGTVDKMINGQLQELEFTILYNSGNERRKKACLIFQEGARKAGVSVNVTQKDFNVMSDLMKKHEFDAAVSGWISSPLENDPKQIWHSTSSNGGSNYVNYGSVETDALIESLRKELDQNKRIEYYMQLQEVIHNDVPYIFLVSPTERIAIHKKVENAYASAMRPGYWPGSFQIRTGNAQ